MPKQKYKHPLKHYANLYSVSASTIARYAKAEYPLDDEHATRLRIEGQKFQPPRRSDTPPNSPECPPQPPKPVVGVLGVAASIQRLQEAEARANAEYLAARDEVAKSRLQKSWLALVEQLRKVENDSPDIQEANNKSVSVDDLEQSLAKTFNVFRQELEQLPKRTANELVGKDVIAIREVLAKEVRDILDTLYKCEWLSKEDKQ